MLTLRVGSSGAALILLLAGLVQNVSSACPSGTTCDKSVTLLNSKYVAADGTAFAYLQSGACPIGLSAAQRTYEKTNHNHQKYSFTLATGESCVIEGWDNQATTMKCTKAGADDKILRYYADRAYAKLPCPAGCESQCKTLDPNWATTVVQMFSFEWSSATPVVSSNSATTTGVQGTGVVGGTVKKRRFRRVAGRLVPGGHQ